MNIMQYESKIWSTADLLRGSGIKESEWPSFMMPFFALIMIESRLVRMIEEMKADFGEDVYNEIDPEDRAAIIRDKGQGYNSYLLEQNKNLADICQNDKSFRVDFDAYLSGFDDETRGLLGVDVTYGEKYLDIRGVITKLNAKKVLLGYTKKWSEIDLKPFNNSEITDLEEHIKRRWADISAETAGEQYTPDDVIALVAEINASRITPSNTMLKIYDCTCGGGNMLFGVEDRIQESGQKFTQTFGQDWNDALFALARIESRFRADSHIEHGNTLTDDKFYNDVFDVVVANPPYGVDWKGFQVDIKNDKTGRFHYLPSVSDGQLLFLQHLVSKLEPRGLGVVVHNGSTLFSGDAGSSESNIRKWLLDTDVVEALVQLPTDEFFNTGIYTYLWVINKNKAPERKDKIMLINASEKYSPLKKSKGAKRKEVDAANRQEIVETLTKFEDNNYARVFDKEYFYFNKQAIQLTNVDHAGKSFEERLKEGKKSQKLTPTRISNGDLELTEFDVTEFDKEKHKNLKDAYDDYWKPLLAALDYKEQPLVVTTAKARYSYDSDKETLVREANGQLEELGNGKIVIKSNYSKKTKTRPAYIAIKVELTPDYEKDYEIIDYHRDQAENWQAIEAFMAKYITRPFEYLENTIGVEINFNKVFYKPEELREVDEILCDIDRLDRELSGLEVTMEL